MKKAILFLIVFCFVANLRGQEECDTLELQPYMRKQLLKCDTVNWSLYPKIQDIESADKKIRLLTFSIGYGKRLNRMK